MHVLDVVRAPSDLVVAGVGARRLDEGQWLGGRGEGQFTGVVGVVQAQGEHATGGGWQPGHLVFMDQAAIGQAQVVVFDRDVVDLAVELDTGVFHR
ncbi:hypothetical protein D3C80_1795430 [compost metagenome]